MKIVIPIIATVAFGLTACNEADSEPRPVETVTVSPTAPETTEAPSPTPESTVISDEEFADFIRENTDAFDSSPDADIVAAAQSVCDLWSTGATQKDVVNVIIDSGVDPLDGSYLAGAGTAAYCPEYEDRIK